MNKRKKESRRKIDRQVGANLRNIRIARGLTQQQLAQEIGLTFQQLQKYEHGKNRISASVLYEISKILEVFIEEFFAGLPTSKAQSLPHITADHFALIHLYDATPKQIRKAIIRLFEGISANRKSKINHGRKS